MNQLNDLIHNNKFENGKLYLLIKPTEKFGFFYQDNIVYFGKMSAPHTESFAISTSYLDLNLNVPIESLTLDASFDSGNYDLLAYKGKLDEETYFDIFYNICNAYCFDTKNISFYDFFKSLAEIFKKESNCVQNLIGLIGELLTIKWFYDEKHVSIADEWHLSGSNSKFDFSFKNANLEIKSTLKSDSIFVLKHSQIFNNQNNFVCICNLIENGMGYSINNLKEFFENEPIFAHNVKFQIALNTEVSKVSEYKDRCREFVLDSIKFYSVKDMPTLENVPTNITDISYQYDFSDIKESSFFEIVEFD